MIRLGCLLLAASPLFGQTAAGMLARLNGVSWEAPPTPGCTPRNPVQSDTYATVEWTHHCTRYALWGDPRGLLLRLRRTGTRRPLARRRATVDESPENTARLLPALQRALTARFGAPTHEPALMEIGFRPMRYRSLWRAIIGRAAASTTSCTPT